MPLSRRPSAASNLTRPAPGVPSRHFELMNPRSGNQNLAFVGNYLPRLCGIATFTTDLCTSVAAQFPEGAVLRRARQRHRGGYDYPPRSAFEIEEQNLASYRRAADFWASTTWTCSASSMSSASTEDPRAGTFGAPARSGHPHRHHAPHRAQRAQSPIRSG